MNAKTLLYIPSIGHILLFLMQF